MAARIPILIIGAMFLLAVSAGVARAHPHVWILAEAVLTQTDGKVTGVRLDWSFDPFFSTVLYEDFDWNDDGRFDTEERRAMRDGAFAGLSAVGWFTDVRVDGEPWPVRATDDFDVRISPDDGTVTYELTLAFDEPTDPVATSVTLSLYDPEYYISLEFAEKAAPVRVVEDAPFSCVVTIGRDESTSLYYGAFNPPLARFDCAPARS
ncbi:DUF1007 family protein [Marivibrio halodurans]|uniref:DUF1007 family protein n=1 Tax=Marivibrio halodurans TaxID=2039722 RepID=A0A8J7V1B6_9PROT|nr:DUF1007 family protein [Marivibrio halodurans]MBP5855941.1 DUF1007 family protein [Marivibrio halodurans]